MKYLADMKYCLRNMKYAMRINGTDKSVPYEKTL